MFDELLRQADLLADLSVREAKGNQTKQVLIGMAEGAKATPKRAGVRGPDDWSAEGSAERSTRSARAALDQAGEFAGHQGLHYAPSILGTSRASVALPGFAASMPAVPVAR